jgi:hypothetical protein
MLRKKSIYMISVLLLMVNIILAQNVNQTADIRLSGDVPYTFIGKHNGSIIICMQSDGLYDVKKFTHTMGEWSTIEVPSIPIQCKQLLFVKKDTNFIAFFEMQSSGNSIFYTQLFDTNFKAIGTNVKCTSIEKSKTNTSVVIEQSENKKRMALYYISKDEDGNGFANYMLLTDALQSTKWQSIALGNMDMAINMEMVVFNQTNAAISIAFVNKEGLTESMQLYPINAANEVGKPLAIDLKNKSYNYRIMQADNAKQSVLLCLTYAATSRDEKNIIKKISYNLATNQIEKNVEIPINDVANKANEVSSYANYLPRQMIAKSNGDMLFVAEYFDMKEVIIGTDMNGSGAMGTPFRISRQMKKYDYSDVLVTSISDADTVQWQMMVHKEQLSDNDDGYYSSYSLAVLKNKIVVLFNALDNNATVQQASIDADGKSIYAILNEAKLDAKNIVFKKAKQISNNEVIVPCVRQNIYSFVKIRL